LSDVNHRLGEKGLQLEEWLMDIALQYQLLGVFIISFIGTAAVFFPYISNRKRMLFHNYTFKEHLISQFSNVSL